MVRRNAGLANRRFPAMFPRRQRNGFSVPRSFSPAALRSSSRSVPSASLVSAETVSHGGMSLCSWINGSFELLIQIGHCVSYGCFDVSEVTRWLPTPRRPDTSGSSRSQSCPAHELDSVREFYLCRAQVGYAKES